MNLTEIKNTLSVRGKNGIGFLLAGTVVWAIITVIFLQPIEIQTKNILMLFATGIMFPLSIAMSALLKAEWRFSDIPLSVLGLYLNFAQFIYFPILFWALVKSPNEMILFFAIITGAHFFPYGWLYNAKAFYFMSPFISIIVLFIGWSLEPLKLWLIPAAMVLLLTVLIGLLYLDFQKKTHFNATYLYHQN